MAEIDEINKDSIDATPEKRRPGRPRVYPPRVPKPPRQRKVFTEAIVRKTISIEESIWKRLKIIGIWENRTDELLINEALTDFALRAERERSAEEQLTQALMERDHVKHKRKYKRKKK